MSSKEYRIVFTGCGGDGKSSVIIQFVSGHFPEEYDPTIEDKYTKGIEVDGRQCRVEAIDTSGLEEYSALREQFIRLGQGFVLVYSVTDLGSFKWLNDYYEEIIDIKGTRDVPVVLVGNKCDLESSRKVTTEQGGGACEEA